MRRATTLFVLVMFYICGFVQAADIPFEFHAPYRYGVIADGGGSGSYYGQGYHTGNSYYCIDFNVGDGWNDYQEPVTAIAGGTVVAVGKSDIYHTYYSYDVTIMHEDGYYSTYVHLDSNVVTLNTRIQSGQIIGYVGNEGESTAPHLHFCLFDPSGNSVMPSPMDGTVYDEYGAGRDVVSQNREFSAETESAISHTADLLWNTRPYGGSDCTDGLICHETNNMHWWEEGGEKMVIEDWTDGLWDWIALTYDPDYNSSATRSYILRGGIWEYYRNNGGIANFGSPWGDELDLARFDEYASYDPICDENYGNGDGSVSWDEIEHCINSICGSTATYSSLQHFEHRIFCWNSKTGQAELREPICYNYVAPPPLPVNNTLVRPNDDDPIYLVESNKLHHIPTTATFERCGYSWGAVATYPPETLAQIPLSSDQHLGKCLPSGSFLRSTATQRVYRLENQQRRYVTSTDTMNLCGWNWNSIEDFDDETVVSVPQGSDLNPTNAGCLHEGDLLCSTSNSRIYYVQSNQRRYIVNTEVFNACKYNWDKVKDVAESTITSMTATSDITLANCVYNGDLLHDTSTDKIYVMESGKKRWIVGTVDFNACKYSWDKVKDFSSGTLSAIPNGSNKVCTQPTTNGQLIRSEASDPIYVYYNGQKRYIATVDLFNACKYNWGAVKEYAQYTIDAIPKGTDWNLGNCLPTGSLLKNTSNNKIYYLDRGSKRWFATGSDYKGCGYTWGNETGYPSYLIDPIPTGSNYKCK